MDSLLLAVCGVSPAIITETLYGIAARGEPWPKRIRIITTSRGRKTLWQGLVEEGHLAALCEELERPPLPIIMEDIKVVPNASGEEVADARSAADHEALADFIMTEVRNLTQADHYSIHASIAGGRKTMTFYLGYAMSLFGRHFDCLSHVLVSDGFENHPDFYFPTRDSHLIQLPDGREFDTRDAEVTLADIPFIRQRHLLPGLLKDMGAEVRFREIVALINLGYQPEDIRLWIDREGQRLSVGSARDQELRVSFTVDNTWYWSFYLLLLEDTCKPAQEREGYARPAKDKPDAVLAAQIAYRLAYLHQLDIRGPEFSDLANGLSGTDWLIDRDPNLERSLHAVLEHGGVTSGQFDTYLNTLQSLLSKQLPENLLHTLLPRQIFSKDGERLPRGGKSRNKGGAYGINLPHPTDQIKFQ